MNELKFDPNRMNGEFHDYCGIYVRALKPDGKYDNANIFELDKESVINFLRSRGDESRWMESVVLHLLGHS